MSSNNIWSTLNEAMTKVETEFGLSDIFQKNGLSRDEPVTVEFRCGDETLSIFQRHREPSSTQCYWVRADEQKIENPGMQQLNRNFGQDLVEILNKADMLSSFKNALLQHGVTISEEQPVIVQFRLANGAGLTWLKCPCDNRPCCQIG